MCRGRNYNGCVCKSLMSFSVVLMSLSFLSLMQSKLAQILIKQGLNRDLCHLIPLLKAGATSRVAGSNSHPPQPLPSAAYQHPSSSLSIEGNVCLDGMWQCDRNSDETHDAFYLLLAMSWRVCLLLTQDLACILDHYCRYGFKIGNRLMKAVISNHLLQSSLTGFIERTKLRAEFGYLNPKYIYRTSGKDFIIIWDCFLHWQENCLLCLLWH